MLLAFDTARAQLDASPEEAAKETFGKLTEDEVSKFVKTVMTSHGLGTRTSMLAQKLFEAHFNSLAEMKETIKLCEAQPRKFIELMLVKTFATNDGSIEWDRVVEFAKKKETNTTGTGAEGEDSDEEMIPADDDDETGGGGGGLKNPKKGKGKGRARKANTIA